MVNTLIPWSELDEYQFQDLCADLLTELYQRRQQFTTYAVRGQAQDGIDVVSDLMDDLPNGRVRICVQAKRYKKLSPNDVEKAITVFKMGAFYPTTKKFYLITTAPIIDKKTKRKINEWEARLAEKGVAFDVYYAENLNKFLRRQYAIVARYFSPELADSFCLATSDWPALPFDKPPTDLEREVIPWELNTSRWLPPPTNAQKEKDFLQMILKSEQPHLFCLVGEAYQGKSTFLQQMATNCPTGSQIAWLDAKKLAGDTLEDDLTNRYRHWKSHIGNSLLIVIDGLDEVAFSAFERTVDTIVNFSQKYPYAKLLVSCRTVFFHLHLVAQKLKQFRIYQLLPLNPEEARTFSEKKLGAFAATDFEELIRKAGMETFLSMPFFLTSWISAYQVDRYNFPATKTPLLEAAITAADTKLEEKVAGRSLDLRQTRTKLAPLLEQLALALQLMGTNDIQEKSLQSLFDNEEIETLTLSGVLTNSNGNWSFINAFFQEYYAALRLRSFTIDEIKKVATVGHQIVKIRTKWIQTVATLLGLLPEEHELKQPLMELVQQDDIELLFQSENSVGGADFITDLLRQLLEKVDTFDIGLQLLHPYRIAQFIQGNQRALAVLLQATVTENAEKLSFSVACEVLAHSELNTAQRRIFVDQSQPVVKAMTDLPIAAKIIEVYTHFREAPDDLLQLVTSHPAMRQQLFGWRATIDWLIAVQKVDEYFSYGLDAIKFLNSYNERTNQIGAENMLYQFFEAARTTTSFKALLRIIAGPEWQDSSVQNGFGFEDFFERLMTNIFSSAHEDPTLLEAIVEYLKQLDPFYPSNQNKNLAEVTQKTGLRPLLQSICMKDMLNGYGLQLGWLLDDSNSDTFFQAVTEETISWKEVHDCLLSLFSMGDQATAFQYKERALDHFGIRKEYEEQPKQLIQINERVRRRHDNDEINLQSLDQFKAAVEDNFKRLGELHPGGDDWSIPMQNRETIQAIDSNAVRQFLKNWHKNYPSNQRLLSQAIKILDTEDYFDRFRAVLIYQYRINKQKEFPELIEHLKGFFYQQLDQYPFENCLQSDADGRLIAGWEQLWLGDIWRRFQFDLPMEKKMQLLWVDLEGWSRDRTLRLGEKSIANLIYEQLDQPQRIAFQDRVLQHLRIGIAHPKIRFWHFQLCQEFRIKPAAPLIAEALLAGGKNNRYFCGILAAYRALGGSPDELGPLFTLTDPLTEDQFIDLLDACIEAGKTDVVPYAEKKFMAPNTTLYHKIDIAIRLLRNGDTEAFGFLLNNLPALEMSRSRRTELISVANIPIETGWITLQPHIPELLAPPRYPPVVIEARNIVYGMLREWSMVDEQRLSQVVQLLKEAFETLSHTHSNAKLLYAYIGHLVEAFRDSNPPIRTIDEIKEIISRKSPSALPTG